DQNKPNAVGWCVFFVVCAAIFAASFARSDFISLAAILMLISLTSTEQVIRKIGFVAVGVLAVSIVAGLLSRPTASAHFLGQLFEAAGNCHEQDNSISQRLTLISEAFRLLPSAGIAGIGLDSFMDRSCIKQEIHNSLLQALIEFGWLGGSTFAVFTVIV